MPENFFTGEFTMDKKYYLKDIFNLYKEYTGYTGEYDSATFAKKLRNTIKMYYPDKKIKFKKEKIKEYSKLKEQYVFNKEEAEILSLLLSCSAPKANKSIHNYNSACMNPLTNENKASGFGISDLLTHTQQFKQYINEYKNIDLDNSRLSDVFQLVEFADNLQKQMSYLITSIFQNQNYNQQTFNRIISRLDGFIQELNLYSGLCEQCDSKMRSNIARAYGKLPNCPLYIEEKYEMIYNQNNPKFHTIDTYVADTALKILCDSENVDENKKEELEVEFQNKNYINYLEYTIPLMVKDFYKLQNTNYDSNALWNKDFDNFCQKYGIIPNPYFGGAYNIETLIFEMYVNPGITNGCTIEELTTDILNQVKKILKEKHTKLADDVSKDSLNIKRQLDLLVLKPFVTLHKNDIEKLKKEL